MKRNPDEIIDQLLQGLRDAEAPAGMELRILHALEERTLAASPATRRRNGSSRRAIRRGYWPVSLGAAVAAMLLLAFVLHRPTQPPVAVAAHSQVPPAPWPTQPHVLPTLGAVASKATPQRPAKKPKPSHAPSLGAEELCLRELRTPSQPEPPEPLTAEEKILLRVAHTAAPEEIALLNPEIRSRQQAASAAEFERFASASANQNQKNQ